MLKKPVTNFQLEPLIEKNQIIPKIDSDKLNANTPLHHKSFHFPIRPAFMASFSPTETVLGLHQRGENEADPFLKTGLLIKGVGGARIQY